MTKEEFIAGYCKRSNITPAQLKELGEVALPCACSYEDCPGWAMVSDNPEAVKSHLELYGPAEEKK